MGGGKGCIHPVLLATSSASSTLGRLARTVSPNMVIITLIVVLRVGMVVMMMMTLVSK